MCIYSKIEFMNIGVLIPLRMKKVIEMSADSAHVQGASGAESTNSLVVSGSHSLTIDAKYVFDFQTLSLSLI